MTNKRIVTGYTTGVFDLFHIGHLNVIRFAKSMCDRLIVGVTSDELSAELKGKSPIMPYNERFEIIQSIKFVDLVVPEIIDDKIKAWEELKFDLIFKGDDWKGTEKWNILEDKFRKIGVKVIFYPYTMNISSTIIRRILEKRITEKTNTLNDQFTSML
jgi:glycerol-3-phosphate cytidylyltransferase